MEQQASRYRIEGLLKQGGDANIYEAILVGDRGFERRVALKQMRPELGANDRFVDKFVDEARIVSQLHHANVVSVFDFGIMDGLPFLAMELVDGVDLQELREQGGNIPVEIALIIAVEVAHALDYAHRAQDDRGFAIGIVHRDVSPQNVLVSFAGDVKLSDFGIALARRRLEQTEVGIAKGKLGFMSPEQMRSEDLDAQTDIYALGCLLQWMLCGFSPLDNEASRDVVRRGGDCSVAPTIDADIAEVVTKATRTDKRRRYSEASELASACGALLAKRIDLDARSMMQGFVAQLRPEKTQAAPAPIAEMMDLELVMGGHGVRRFESVVMEGQTPIDKTDTLEDPAQQETKYINKGPPPAPPPDDETLRAPVVEPAVGDRRIGSTLHGFRLEEVIGAGSLARVYRARHEVLDREVAVKILHGKAETNERSRKRLKREAVALGKLKHPNIVSVLDFGTTEEGLPFLTMELLRGRTLKEVLKSRKMLSPEEAGTIVRQLAIALAAAHAAGIVHRDLKPSNVMLVSDAGRMVIKILDFGIARLVQPDGTRLTASDMLLGTPRYMSPEQIRGASQVGPESDLYALGALLYFMLSGQPPFSGSTLEVVERQLEETPMPLKTGTALDELVLELLAKEPENRPTADDVADRLEDEGYGGSMETRMVPPPPASMPDGTWPLAPSVNPPAAVVHKTPRAMVALMVGLVAAVLILGAALLIPREKKPLTIEAPPPVAVTPQKARATQKTPPPAPPPPPKRLAKAPPRSPPPPRPDRTKSRSRITASEARSRARSALRAKGMTFSDARRTPALAAVTRRVERATDADAEAASAAFKQALSQFEMSESLVKAKLDRISRSLVGASKRMNKKEFDALENRYLDLRSSLRPNMSGAELQALAKKVGSLERSVSGR